MRNFTVQKSDFHKVACVEEIPEGAGTIVIAVHGFTSSKESPTVRRLLNRLPAAGIGVVGIDLPGHGTEDSFGMVCERHVSQSGDLLFCLQFRRLCHRSLYQFQAP